MEPQVNIAELAQAFKNLQGQFNQAQAQINQLNSALNAANQTNVSLKQALDGANPTGPTTERPKLRKPELFKGKGSVHSWIEHMDNYLQGSEPTQALAIATSYLDGNAHEWWIVFRTTQEGSDVKTWDDLKEALRKRFQPLNKKKAARDKLAKWKQVKDVSSFNEDFLRIILDIPYISMEEQIDRYTRGLKPYIWKELCTRDYNELGDAMRDAERVEAAHKRLGSKPTTTQNPQKPNADTPVPMDLGNVKLGKLTPAEREQCKKEGRCFRCRQKGHISKTCPKGQRN